MMNHPSPAGTAATAASNGDWYASEAEKAAGKLADALDLAGTIVPPGFGLQVHGHGYLAVANAVLALRDEMREHRIDTGNALTEIDTTLGIALGAIPPGPAEALAAAGTQGRPPAAPAGATHVLTWMPRYKHGVNMWDIQPARGWEHLDRPDPWPVPDLPRDATAAQVEEWACGKLGYRVTATRRRRLVTSLRGLRAWPQPEWTLAPADGPCDATAVGVIATGYDGRYLLTRPGRPGPLRILAPPCIHAGGQPWAEAAHAALAAAAIAPAVHEGASGWRANRCRRAPAAIGTGHSWVIFTAPGASDAPGASILDRGEWVPREELQEMADRTIGYAAGLITAAELDGPGLAPEWIGWLAGSVIAPVAADDIARCAQLAHA